MFIKKTNFPVYLPSHKSVKYYVSVLGLQLLNCTTDGIRFHLQPFLHTFWVGLGLGLERGGVAWVCKGAKSVKEFQTREMKTYHQHCTQRGVNDLLSRYTQFFFLSITDRSEANRRVSLRFLISAVFF